MELNELLDRVDQLKAEIDALRPIDAAQERRIMQKFRLDWTFHSNKLEGNTLTYGETKWYFKHGQSHPGRPVPIRDYLDVQGHIDAIAQLMLLVNQEQRLTEADIRELHKLLLVKPYQMDALTPDGRPTTRTVQLGQYKSGPNNVVTSTGEMHFYATPEETPAKMGDLMDWYRRELDKGEIHPLKLAAIFHYEFVAIHPFDDGNGRMARLLMNLIFMQAGYPPVIIRTEDKNSYLLALEQADTGDLEPFIVHIGNELLNSLNLYLRGAKGEDIEEIGDLDKKLALLEKKLEAQEIDQEDKRLSQEEQREALVNNFLAPFFFRLTNQLAKFNRLFLESNFLFSRGGGDTQFFAGEMRVLVKHLSEMMGKLTPLEFRYLWKRLKANPDFNLWLVVGVELRDEEFEITYAANSEEFFSVIKDAYGKNYSSEQIEKQAVKIANEIYEVIEQQAQ